MNDPDSFRFLDLILSVIQKIPLDNKKTKGIFVYKKVMYINLVIPSVLKIKTAQQGKLTSRRSLKKRELPITHLERYPYQSFWTKLRPISFMNILPVEVFSSFFYFHDFERFSSFFCVTVFGYSANEIVFQKLMFCKAVYTRLEFPLFHHYFGIFSF